MPEEYGILVGVDGSAESDAAVRWATREAVLRNELITFLHVVPPSGCDLADARDTSEHRQVAKGNSWDVIEHARKTLFAEVGESPPEVQADVVYSHVVPTLIDASKQARGKGWTATIMKERYMIEYDLDTEHSILHVQPKSAIERDDFAKVAEAVDPHIEATGGLAGLIIEAPAFPGWESLGAMVNHLRFVRDHHKRIKRIGVVTDSHLGDFAEHLASHFVSAEIRHFPAGQIEAARQWIINGS